MAPSQVNTLAEQCAFQGAPPARSPRGRTPGCHRSRRRMSERRPKYAVAQPGLAFAARDFLAPSLFYFFDFTPLLRAPECYTSTRLNG